MERAERAVGRVGRRFWPVVNRLVDVLVRPAVLILPLIGVVLLLFPLLFTISMSFDARDYLGPFPPSALSLRWYESFLSNSYLLDGLKTSLLLATAATGITTGLSLSSAAAIDRLPSRPRDLITSLFLAPLIVPGVVLGFALLLFCSRIGIGNGFLRLLTGHIIITFPYALRAILVAFGNVRPSFTEAAMSLGATEWSAFRSMTLPLAKGGIVAGAAFAFAFSLDDVAATIFLSGPQSYTLPVALVSMMYSNFNLTIAAVAVTYVGFTALLMIILDRLVGLDRIVGGSLFST